jgi:Aldo/keto reductase family
VATIVSVQNRYNLTDRFSEPVLSACERDGIAFLPWSPLAVGSDTARVSGAIAEIAARYQATPAQVAIAWLLARTPAMLPIPGTSSPAHLEENMQAARLQLSAADLRALDWIGSFWLAVIAERDQVAFAARLTVKASRVTLKGLTSCREAPCCRVLQYLVGLDATEPEQFHRVVSGQQSWCEMVSMRTVVPDLKRKTGGARAVKYSRPPCQALNPR